MTLFQLQSQCTGLPKLQEFDCWWYIQNPLTKKGTCGSCCLNVVLKIWLKKYGTWDCTQKPFMIIYVFGHLLFFALTNSFHFAPGMIIRVILPVESEGWKPFSSAVAKLRGGRDWGKGAPVEQRARGGYSEDCTDFLLLGLLVTFQRGLLNFWGCILPETNIAPENGWLEYFFPFGMTIFRPIFRGEPLVSGRVVVIVVVCVSRCFLMFFAINGNPWTFKKKTHQQKNGDSKQDRWAFFMPQPWEPKKTRPSQFPRLPPKEIIRPYPGTPKKPAFHVECYRGYRHRSKLQILHLQPCAYVMHWRC